MIDTSLTPSELMAKKKKLKAEKEKLERSIQEAKARIKEIAGDLKAIDTMESSRLLQVNNITAEELQQLIRHKEAINKIIQEGGNPGEI